MEESFLTEVPAYTRSGLSQIMSASTASHILGEGTVRNIVLCFLRCIASQTAHNPVANRPSSVNQNENYIALDIDFCLISDNIFELQETEEEQRWTDLFTTALLFDFEANKSVPRWCAAAWHRLINIARTDSIAPTASSFANIQPKVVIPLLALDKTIYFRSMFPPSAAPRQGPGGHMVLLECLFHALASPHPSISTLYNSSTSNAGVSGRFAPKRGANGKIDTPLQSLQNSNRSIIILPDLIIFWGIVKDYQVHIMSESVVKPCTVDVAVADSSATVSEIDGNTAEQNKAQARRITFTKEQKIAVNALASLAFRVYDGYLKNALVSRDTLQRFVADIYGEESLKRPIAKKIFESFFDANFDARSMNTFGTEQGTSLPPAPGRHLAHLDELQFNRSIWKTITINLDGQAVHTFLDWLPVLGLATLPTFVTQRRSPHIQRMIQAKVEMIRNYNPSVEIQALAKKYGIIYEDTDTNYNTKSESVEVPAANAADNSSGRLMDVFEVKRRFRSIAEKSLLNKSTDIADAESEHSDDASSSGFEGDEGHHLPLDEIEDLSASKHSLSKNRGSNVILEEAFVSAASRPNDEMGHGGFLCERLARLIFKAGCRAMQRFSAFRSLMTKLAEESSFAHVLKDRVGAWHTYFLNEETVCWTFYDALYFGCLAVRANLPPGSEQNGYVGFTEAGLLEFIFSMLLLLPRSTAEVGSNIQALSRSQVGHMILLLLEQAAFRLQADSPVSYPIDKCLSTASTSNTVNGFAERIKVNITEASILGLLPPDLDGLKSHHSSDFDENRVDLDIVIDYVFKEAGVDVNITNDLSFDDLVRWYTKQSQHISPLSIFERRLGPIILDLRVFASIIFGVKPLHQSMEKLIIHEVIRRHKRRYPLTDSAKRGPAGTVWYIIQSRWWNNWIASVDASPDDELCKEKIPKIDNTPLLLDSGPLALKSTLLWKKDYEIIPPLVWSAIQGWYDGGPFISRSVVVSLLKNASSTSMINRLPSKLTEIEMYPLFVTVLLLDSTCNGKPRPFQQYFPMSNHLPVLVVLKQLCQSLDVDTKLARLWFLGNRSTLVASSSESDWILKLDLGILYQIKERGLLGANDDLASKNLVLLFEVQDSMSGKWPKDQNDLSSNTLKTKDEMDTLTLGDGIVGLYNMGNTCYLNASIQCLSHTPIFRDYFTSKAYLNDINTTNPLGHQGKLAQVCATLINAIWRQSNKINVSNHEKRLTRPGHYLINAPSLTPKSFKDALSSFNDHFAGNDQHDAQELLAFLLSGLSEDLNRIVNKPYIEAPDSDGRPDEELADIWWSNHLKRELSLIVALFAGQYKSLLSCGTCRYESARFEPFAFLQVPLPDDDQITVNLYLYCITDGIEPVKYSVRTKYNGTLRDLLIELAKIRVQEQEIRTKKDSSSLKTEARSDQVIDAAAELNGDSETEKYKYYSEMAVNLTIVRMGDSYIHNIVPDTWSLSKVTIRETGELPTLCVYELDPLKKELTSKLDGEKHYYTKEKSNTKNPDVVQQEDSLDCNMLNNPIEATTAQGSDVKPAFFALLQRKVELTKRPFLHPWCQLRFGTPFVLRVPDLEGFTGRDIYDLVANRLKNYVPASVLPFLTPQIDGNDVSICKHRGLSVAPNERKRSGRMHLERTRLDMEDVLFGDNSRYGFVLRICCRDGTRCSRCPWFSCCIGCIVPDDHYPTFVVDGDSIAIDWQLTVDLSTDGFEEKIGDSVAVVWDHVSSNKNGRSRAGKFRSEYRASVKLQECLEAFAEKEQIPEAYCSKCKEFRVQTKMMSLWRLPPVMIIHLKRFQFTQHMRRKLRELVTFPLEGLDFSRITASDPRRFLKPQRLSRWVDECDEDRNNILYDLYGVIHHHGALSGGHYFASLKSTVDGKWRLFDDAQVYEINSDDVIDASAYILFYVRRDVKNAKLEDFWKPKTIDGEGITEEAVEKMIKQRERCVIS